MADRAAIRQRAIRRTAEKATRSVTWGDVVSAFQAATGPERQAFAAAIYQGTPSELKQTVEAVMRPYIVQQATLVVDAALADDTLTLDELEQILL